MPDPRTLLRRRPLLALIILLVLLGIGYGVRGLKDDGGSDRPQPSATATAHVSQPGATQSGATQSGATQDPVALSSLPSEASDTVRLIKRGGPYPYRQDGVVFNNAERHLPIRPSGYYHEFTVTTPGSSDRGARRIITGSGGQFYYTANHYDSFVSVNVSG
jgi:ribonuclease T1